MIKNNLFFIFFYRLWLKVLSFFQYKPSIQTNPTIVELNNSFINKNKSHFLTSSENLDVNTKNSQIEPFFYNKKEYLLKMEEPNNQYEKTWKSRILIRSIPQGTNVIMYYDPYKLGFAYYCDQTIPYNILNSIAMKYVLLYKCYDFFLDECITAQPSPLLKLLEDDKPEPPALSNAESVKKSNENKELKELLKRAPIAKFKNYNKAVSSVVSDPSGKKSDTKAPLSERNERNGRQEKPEKPKERNRFVYLGKTANFSFLQKVVKKPTVRFNDSSLIKSGLFANSEVQKEVFNYRDFKKMKEMKEIKEM